MEGSTPISFMHSTDMKLRYPLERKPKSQLKTYTLNIIWIFEQCGMDMTFYLLAFEREFLIRLLIEFVHSFNGLNPLLLSPSRSVRVFTPGLYRRGYKMVGIQIANMKANFGSQRE